MKLLPLVPVLAGLLALLAINAPRAEAQVRPPTPLPPGSTEDHRADVAAGQAAAENWLRLIDAGDYGRSWQESASHFHSIVSEEQWTGGLANKRLPRGKVVSRNVTVTRFSPTVPGGSTGRYVLVQFQTQFENKTAATETLVSMLDTDGRWKVAGYYLK